MNELDNLFNFLITYYQIIAWIVGLIIAAISIFKFIQNQKDRQMKVFMEKVKGNDHRIRQIRVRYRNKPIERCNVSFNGILLIWDSTENQHEFTIMEGGARNATIPDEIFTEDAKIVIKSGKKIIKKIHFKDMETSH